jgi:hypothetical protein
MNKLTSEARVRVISCLVEGNSIRSTVRYLATDFLGHGTVNPRTNELHVPTR